MKAVILAGGLGSRLSEETVLRPKPLVEIGGRPILWHIMKIYEAHGVKDFIICCGHKGFMIKEYFANYYLHTCDVTFNLATNSLVTHRSRSEDWTVTLIDTGENTMTGGRLRRVREFIGDEAFCFTYGDGVGNVDIAASIASHRASGKKATLTVAAPPGRFGAVKTSGTTVTAFEEKPHGDGGYINAGFFVLEPSVIEYIDGDNVMWERQPLETLAKEGELSAWFHDGFWQPMDTLRDKHHLEDLWQNGDAPWKIWE